ncbi:MAG: flagellar motor switch protein FliN [Treponemataceae bacterium]|nr:flagellar motor switch protein FliN [Treponemataceae bacterium]
MSDGAISQDEIDALLSGVSVDGLNSSGHVSGSSAVHIDGQAFQKFIGSLKDPLVEKLNGMTGASFEGGQPSMEEMDRDGLLSKLPEVVIAVSSDYSSGIKDEHLYVLAPEFAQKLVNLISKEENADFDDMALSCICDVVSIHTNDEIMELDKTGKFPGLACNPAEAVNNPKAMIRIPQDRFALVSYPLSLDGQSYTLWEVIGGKAAEQISGAYGGGAAASGAPAGAPNAADMSAMPNMAAAQPQMMQQPQMNMGMNQMAMGMGQMAMGMNQMAMPNMGMPMGQMPMGMNVPNVQTLQYPMLQGASAGSEQGNIGLLMDVFMEMTVELGRTKKQIKDILSMGEGTIIELDKLAGEPVDILVNHKPIAKGEVVVIDENFGVRVTEILSPLERVSDLR